MEAMHGPAANAITVLLFGLAGLLLLACAKSWANVARDRERPNERPTVPVSALRSAAAITGATLAALGLAAIWLALVSLP